MEVGRGGCACMVISLRQGWEADTLGKREVGVSDWVMTAL